MMKTLTKRQGDPLNLLPTPNGLNFVEISLQKQKIRPPQCYFYLSDIM